MVDNDTTYAEMLRSIKWSNKERKEPETEQILSRGTEYSLMTKQKNAVKC